MKKLLLLVTSALLVASASRVMAQQTAPNPAPQTAVPTRNVTIAGAIANPGIYALSPGENVAALLARAGGAVPSAAPENAFVMRATTKISLDSQTAESLQKFILREGDLLVVPESKYRILVMGEVVRPGNFTLPKGKKISVVDALVLAGGVTPDLKELEIGIFRNKPNASIEWHAWPKEIGDDLFRFQLQDGDGLFVRRIQQGGLKLLRS